MPLRQCNIYVDGDGGTLIAEFIPGLLQYATAKGILTQHISSHNYTLIPFQEKFHDAIELGHTYDIRCEQLSGESTKAVKEYGYLALIKAKRNASLAKRAYVVSYGVDASGCRLLIEIYYTEENVPKANIVATIENGLSFPSMASPETFKEATWLKFLEEHHSKNKLCKIICIKILLLNSIHPIALDSTMTSRLMASALLKNVCYCTL